MLRLLSAQSEEVGHTGLGEPDSSGFPPAWPCRTCGSSSVPFILNLSCHLKNGNIKSSLQGHWGQHDDILNAQQCLVYGCLQTPTVLPGCYLTMSFTTQHTQCHFTRLPVTPIGCPVCFSSKCPIGSWQLSPRAARRGLSPENSLSKEFLVVWSLASLLLLALRFCKKKSTFLHGTTEVALKWQQVQWPATFCRKLTLLSLHKTLGEASLGDVCMSWTKA